MINGYYLLGKDWLETAKGVAEGRAAHTARDDHRRQPHRDRRARQVRLRPQEDSASTNSASPSGPCTSTRRCSRQAEAQEEPAAFNGDDERGRRTNGDDDEPVQKLTKNEQAELLRQTVDTVGKVGKPGEQIQNVISVGMLSEGWDAKP